VISMAQEEFGSKPVYLAVVHARDQKSGQALLDQAKSQFNVTETMLGDLSISIAANLGPGTVGLILYPVESMKEKMINRRTNTSNEELEMLESHLAGTLKRVAPPNDIIQRLRGRISRMPIHETITLRLRDWRTLFFVFGGVMSGMLLLVTVARAFYYLASRRNAI
jgi:hypothetical protein